MGDPRLLSAINGEQRRFVYIIWMIVSFISRNRRSRASRIILFPMT